MSLENFYFTPRQRDILRAIVTGHTSYKQIAAHLNMSTGTVRKHLSMIYQATDIHDITALALATIDNGWIKTNRPSKQAVKVR